MEINVRGALRFKHRAGLEKGITAFDANAYPEFFKSELWTLVGPFALCERSFEIEPDCDYREAFLAMAREAVEGTIDLREDEHQHFTRLHKLPKLNTWLASSREAKPDFGRALAEHRAAWADKLDHAKVDDAAKAAKAAKKLAKDASRCTVVELPANPRHVVVRPDGSFAVAAGSKIVFVAPTGELLGTTECRVRDYDQFGGITALHALPDGRVLAFQELDHEARLATLGEPKAVPCAPSPEGKDRPLRSGSSDGSITVLEGRHSGVVLDATGEIERELSPWGEADYVRSVLAWRGRAVVSASDKTAVFERDGTKLFEVAGGDPIPFEGGLVTFEYNAANIVGGDGTVRARIETGSIGWVRDDANIRRAVAVVGGHIVVGTSLPDALGVWDLAGTERWRVKRTHTQGVSGVLPTPRWIACWAEEPIVKDPKRAKDTTIAAYREDGTELARVDAKATVLGAVAVGDDSLATWLDGRTAGNKVLLWRDLSTKPRLDTLTGHKGRVRGLLCHSGQLVSWAADKTLRIWACRS